MPCVLWGSGVPPGESIDGLTDSLDLFPTLLRLAGERRGPAPRPGRPLIVDGALAAGNRQTFSEQHALGDLRRFALLQDDGRKLIVGENRRSGELVSTELYADGHRVEQTALDPALHPATVERLRGRIDVRQAWAEAFHAETVGEPSERALDPEDVERLRSLGYLR